MKVALTFTVMALAYIGCMGAGTQRRERKMHPAIEDILHNVPKRVIIAELKKLLDPNAFSVWDDNLKNYLDSLRKKFPVGIPEFGIPPLDPFFVKSFPFDIQQSFAKLTGSIDNFNITKLASYNIDYTKLNPLLFSAAVNFTMPEIVATGHYDIDGDIEDLFPIYGNGDFKFVVSEFKAGVNIKVGTSGDHAFIRTFDLGFSVGKLTSHFEGLLGGGDQGDLANEMINDIAPMVLNAYSTEISAILSDKIVEIANKFLANVSLKDIIDYITGNHYLRPIKLTF